MTDKHSVLKNVFGFDSFRRGQEDIVDRLIAGENTFAVMPTGAGKSLCYQVPALVRDGLTIVVSPLVALMQDQVAALKLSGVAADAINSSVSRDENVAVWQRVVAGEVRLLYMAPERLMTPRMIEALQKRSIALIAIDEVHCMSQWGAAFRPEYDALKNLRQNFPGVPIGAFTATADEVTREDIRAKLFGGQVTEYVAGFDRPNIKLTVKPKDNAKKQLLEFLSDRRGQSGIVYALSRKSVEEIAAHLMTKGHKAVAYHAGLSAAERSAAQEKFMAERGVIVVATIAFGMGIDKPDVRYVFHADLPATLDAYYQEIGRAGRDGAPAEAHMVYGQGDTRMRRRFINDENAGQERARREHKRLDALVAYCETPDCRRQSLLAYFGETAAPCGHCDGCLEPAETLDGTREARLICDTARLTGNRFGAGHLVDVLLGKLNERASELKHDALAVFGAGQARPRSEWQALVRQVTSAGFLIVDAAGFGGLSLTDKGEALLAGDGIFRFKPDRVLKKATRKGRRDIAAAAIKDTDAERLLYRLKALRLELAAARKVPAYVIFPDRTLIAMAEMKPMTLSEFARVNGVGASKLEQFGQVFVDEIKRSPADAHQGPP